MPPVTLYLMLLVILFKTLHRSDKMKKLIYLLVGLLLGGGFVYAGWETNYSQLAVAPASGDLFLIQDISDSTMSAQGTTLYIDVDTLFDFVDETGDAIVLDHGAASLDISAHANVEAVADDSANAVAAIGRDISAQAFTNDSTQTTITEAHMLANKFLTNQGDDAETDLIFTAVSYYIEGTIKDTEGTGFELCPPSGEALYLDGTAIAADDCIDWTGELGSVAVYARQQIANGDYKFYVTTVIGTLVDGNDTGD